MVKSPDDDDAAAGALAAACFLASAHAASRSFVRVSGSSATLGVDVDRFGEGGDGRPATLLANLDHAHVAFELRPDEARALVGAALAGGLIQLVERLVEVGGEVVLLHSLRLEQLGGRLLVLASARARRGATATTASESAIEEQGGEPLTKSDSMHAENLPGGRTTRPFSAPRPHTPDWSHRLMNKQRLSWGDDSSFRAVFEPHANYGVFDSVRITNCTRRFSARFTSVVLGTMGWVAPVPLRDQRLAGATLAWLVRVHCHGRSPDRCCESV